MNRRERDNESINYMKERNWSFIKDLKPNDRLQTFMDLNRHLYFLDPPSTSYILENFNEEAGIEMCQYFHVKEDYTYSCSLGLEAMTICNGLFPEKCNWFNYQFLIDKLSKNLSKNELRAFYDIWVMGIGARYTVQRIDKHLNKHLKEDDIFSFDWFISADNLVDIYHKVQGVDNSAEIIMQYKSILKDNEFNLESKLEKLLIHYLNHFNVSTPPPFTDAEGLRNSIKTKEFDSFFLKE